MRTEAGIQKTCQLLASLDPRFLGDDERFNRMNAEHSNLLPFRSFPRKWESSKAVS